MNSVLDDFDVMLLGLLVVEDLKNIVGQCRLRFGFVVFTDESFDCLSCMTLLDQCFY